MECKFQIGDPVVCVEELNPAEKTIFCRGPVIDEIYHVREIFPGRCLTCEKRHIFIRVKELTAPFYEGTEGGFWAGMFRPLITPEQFMEKDASIPVDSGDKVVEHV